MHLINCECFSNSRTCRQDMTNSNTMLPRWSCNICLEESRDPVCTTCGHLFCWSCLYTWITRRGVESCPVCRFHLDMNNGSIVSIYVTTLEEPPERPIVDAIVIIPPRPVPPQRVLTSWVDMLTPDSSYQLWRRGNINRNRSLASLRQELNVLERRNAYVVDTANSDSQISTRNAQNSNGNRMRNLRIQALENATLRVHSVQQAGSTESSEREVIAHHQAIMRSRGRVPWRY